MLLLKEMIKIIGTHIKKRGILNPKKVLRVVIIIQGIMIIQEENSEGPTISEIRAAIKGILKKTTPHRGILEVGQDIRTTTIIIFKGPMTGGSSRMIGVLIGDSIEGDSHSHFLKGSQSKITFL